MNELDTRALLARLAADPAPPTTISVDRAVVTARQQRRRTHWLVSAAAVVVVLLLFGVVAVFKPEADGAVQVAAPRDGAASFDPTRTRLTVGWLPGDPPGVDRTVTRDVETVRSAAQDKSVTVFLARTGMKVATDWDSSGAESLGTPVPGLDVNGTAATWYPAPQVAGSSGYLRWEWAPGAQAVVAVERYADPKAVALRVAKSVRTDEKRFELPLKMDVPAGATVRSVSLTRGGGGKYTAVATFDRKERPGAMLTVTVMPDGGGTGFSPNTTLGKHPAAEAQQDIWYRIRMEWGKVAIVEVKDRSDDAAPASVAAVAAECRQIVQDVVVVGDLADPESWTRNPFRVT